MKNEAKKWAMRGLFGLAIVIAIIAVVAPDILRLVWARIKLPFVGVVEAGRVDADQRIAAVADQLAAIGNNQAKG